jgi:PD-(D/E)XK nuclease superfamily
MTPRDRSSFAPVFLEPGQALDGKASMTFLRHTNSCPRSGFMYAQNRRRGVQTVPMVRGSAVHAVMERSTRAMLDTGEPQIPPELCKAIVNEVLAEFAVPFEEHDFIRELSFRWADQWRIGEEKVIACETLFVLDLAGWQIRCKVDFAALEEETKRIYVGDYKSGRGAPAYDEIARKRQDGSMAAKNFQLVLYVLAIVFGQPVTEGREPCLNCESKPDAPDLCTSCAGTGWCRTEVVGEQVARGCPEAIAEFVYPGIENSDGLMLRRTMGLTRLEMLEYRESLEALLTRVSDMERTGDWPAVVSDTGCAECPCPQECPIPRELRDYSGTINTVEEAAVALERRYVRRKQDEALGRELRAFAKAQGGAPIPFGSRVIEFVPTEKVVVREREEMWKALADGMPLAEAEEQFVKVSRGTSFAERELSDDEIEGVGGV